MSGLAACAVPLCCLLAAPPIRCFAWLRSSPQSIRRTRGVGCSFLMRGQIEKHFASTGEGKRTADGQDGQDGRFLLHLFIGPSRRPGNQVRARSLMTPGRSSGLDFCLWNFRLEKPNTPMAAGLSCFSGAGGFQRSLSSGT